jgi:putative membrane protein
VNQAEKATGAQIVLAVVGRCDSYPEIPWKAFAMGVSVAALVVLLFDQFLFAWTPLTTLIVEVSLMLLTGVVFALMTIWSAGLARLFLAKTRAEEEVRQYAEALFLERELFATSQRTGILLLIGMFERQVMILPDAGVQDFLGQETIEGIISSMAPVLAAGNLGSALENALEGLEKNLAGKIGGGPSTNELANDIIEEKGV